MVGRATVVRLNGVDEMDSVGRWCAYAPDSGSVCSRSKERARRDGGTLIRRRAAGPSLQKPTTSSVENIPSTTNTTSSPQNATLHRKQPPSSLQCTLYAYVIYHYLADLLQPVTVSVKTRRPTRGCGYKSDVVKKITVV